MSLRNEKGNYLIHIIYQIMFDLIMQFSFWQTEYVSLVFLVEEKWTYVQNILNKLGFDGLWSMNEGYKMFCMSQQVVLKICHSEGAQLIFLFGNIISQNHSHMKQDQLYFQKETG